MTVASNIQFGVAGGSLPASPLASGAVSDSALGSFAQICSPELSVSAGDESVPETSTAQNPGPLPAAPTMKPQSGKPSKSSLPDSSQTTASNSLLTLAILPALPMVQDATVRPCNKSVTVQSQVEGISEANIPDASGWQTGAADRVLPPDNLQVTTSQMAGCQTIMSTSNEGPTGISAASLVTEASPSQATPDAQPIDASLDEQVSTPGRRIDAPLQTSPVAFEGTLVVTSTGAVCRAMDDHAPASTSSQPKQSVEPDKIRGDAIVSLPADEPASLQVSSFSEVFSVHDRASAFLDRNSSLTSLNDADPTQPEMADAMGTDIPKRETTVRTVRSGAIEPSIKGPAARDTTATSRSTPGSSVEQRAEIARSLFPAVFPDGSDPSAAVEPRLTVDILFPGSNDIESCAVPSTITSSAAASLPTNFNSGHTAQGRRAADRVGTNADMSGLPSTAPVVQGKGSASSDSDDQVSKLMAPGSARSDPVSSPSLLIPPAPSEGGPMLPRQADMPVVQGNPNDRNISEKDYGARTETQPATTVVAGPVQLVRLAENAAQSEMRIGLNTSAFGTVQVRTIVHASEVGVQIGSEKGDLRSLLSNDLPGIAHTLQQQDLRLTQVSFQQNGFSSPGGPSQQNSQSRPFNYRQNTVVLSTPEPPSAEMDSFPEVNVTRNGLSLLA